MFRLQSWCEKGNIQDNPRVEASCDIQAETVSR